MKETKLSLRRHFAVFVTLVLCFAVICIVGITVFTGTQGMAYAADSGTSGHVNLISSDSVDGNTITETYNGEKFDFVSYVENWDDIKDKVNVIGADNLRNAETYYITVELKDGEQWSDGTDDAASFTFVIKKALVTVTPVDMTLTYGDIITEGVPSEDSDGLKNSQGYFYKLDGIDSLAGKLNVHIGSSYVPGHENGSVGTYEIGVTDLTLDEEGIYHGVPNYDVKFLKATLTVVPRNVTIEIQDAENHFGLSYYDAIGQRYVNEYLQPLTFKIDDDANIEDVFAPGDYNESIRRERNGGYNHADQFVFTLKTDQSVLDRTANVGEYGIYAVVSDYYYSKNDSRVPNYNFTFKGTRRAEDEGALKSEGQNFNAGTFTIVKTVYRFIIYGPYQDSECHQQYTLDNDNWKVYDGYSKYFKGAIVDTDQRETERIPEENKHYVEAKYYDINGTLLQSAPKNVGIYSVRFGESNANYDLSVDRRDYEITKAVVTLSAPVVTLDNASGDFAPEMQVNGYLFNGETYLSEWALSGGVNGERIALNIEKNVTYNGTSTPPNNFYADFDAMLSGSSIVLRARNAGVYTLRVELKNDDNFIASNYEFADHAAALSLSFTVLMRNLTVQTPETTVEYGSSTIVFNPNYIVEGISDSRVADRLVQAEEYNNYFDLDRYDVLENGGNVYFTNYAPQNSRFNESYNLYYNINNAISYNFNVLVDEVRGTNENGSLSVVPRNIIVKVKGANNDNTSNDLAKITYAGQEYDYNRALELLWRANRDAFFEVFLNSNVATGEVPFIAPLDYYDGIVLDRVALHVAATAVSAGTYPITPVYSGQRFNVTFHNEKDLEVKFDSDTSRPHMQILPKRVTVAANRGDYKNVLESGNEVNVTFGTEINANYFSYRIFGFVDGESDEGIINKTAGGVTITGIDMNYVAGTSGVGDFATVTPSVSCSNPNYELVTVATTLNITPLSINASVENSVYADGNELTASIKYTYVKGDEVCELNQPNVSITYRNSAGSNIGSPTVAGNYTVTVVLTDRNYMFANDMSVSEDGKSKTLVYVVEKRQISVEWQKSQVGIGGTGAAANVLDLSVLPASVTVETFNVYHGDTVIQPTQDVNNARRYTVNATEEGDYYCILTLDSVSAANYAWVNNNGAAAEGNSLRVAFTAFANSTEVNITISKSQFTYGDILSGNNWIAARPANDPSATVGGANFTVMLAKQSRIGAENGRELTADECGGLTFDIDPNNAEVGHYIAKITYAGTGTGGFLGKVAYYAIEIVKNNVSFSATFNVENHQYIDGDIRLVLSLNDSIFAVKSFTGTAIKDNVNDPDTALYGSYGVNGQEFTFTVTNAGNYTIEFMFADQSYFNNYEIDVTDIRFIKNQLSGTVIYNWTVSRASDNAILEYNGNEWNSDYENARQAETYGMHYNVDARARYSDFVIVEYAEYRASILPSDTSIQWKTEKPTDAGEYWARVTSPSNPNYNAAVAYRRLVIGKAEVIATPYGTLTYGQTVNTRNNDKFGVTFSGYVGDDFGSTISGELNYIVNGYANNVVLDVRNGGYTLSVATNAEGEITTLTSKNYIIKAANGTLNVVPQPVTVQIENCKAYYSMGVDMSNVVYKVIGNTVNPDDLRIRIVVNINPNQPIGQYPFMAVSDNGNYSVNFLNNVCTVESLPIEVVLSQVGGTFGELISEASVISVKNTINGENLNVNDFNFTYNYSGYRTDGTAYSGQSIPNHAGSYSVQVLSNNPYYTIAATSKNVVAFTINKGIIDLNRISVAPLVYDEGNPLTVRIIDDIYNVGDVTAYTVLPYEPIVNAGDYSLRLRLSNSDDFTWSSTSYDTVTLNFTVSRAANEWTQELSIVDWTYGNYVAIVNAPTAFAKFGTVIFEFAHAGDSVYTTKVPSTDDAGTYYVRAYVERGQNHEGLDRTEAVEFHINKVLKTVPTLEVITDGDGRNNVYTGRDLTATILGFDTDIMEVVNDGSFLVSGNKVIVRNANVDGYRIGVGFKASANYAWEGNAVYDQNGNVLLIWSVEKKKVSIDEGKNNLVANGKVLTYLPAGFNADIMNIEGNQSGAGGKFTAIVTLKDTANYMWDDGSIYPLPIEWSVMGGKTVYGIVMGCLAAFTAAAIGVAVYLTLRLIEKKRDEQKEPVDDGSDDNDNKEEQAA